MKNRILIVEDDPLTKELYKYIFRKSGLDFIIMEDGDLIFKELDENNVGLIIMDINLKNTYYQNVKINGVELSRNIKMNKKFSSIPVLIVTASSANGECKKQIKYSMAEDFIAKPITDIKLFVNKIKNLYLS